MLSKEAEAKKYDYDSIDLRGMLLVIWRWKYLIILGSLSCAVIAAIISLNMPKIYNIDMVIRPGILKVNENGTLTYIDTPANIEALVNVNVFNDKILEEINKKYKDHTLKTLSFKTSIQRNSDTIKISYETSNKEQGLKIMEYLGGFLTKEYSKLVDHYKNDYITRTDAKNSEIKNHYAKIQSLKSQIINLQNRIDELKVEINHVNENTKTLMQERDRFLSDQDASKGILSSMLYTNTIQQNISLANTYKNELNKYINEKEALILTVTEIENNINARKAELDALNYKKNSIQNIQQLQSPTLSPDHIKPNKRRIVMLTAIGSSFFFILLSFLFEYISLFSFVSKKSLEGQRIKA